jgi:ribose-phosphate pyrophosphokinase
LLADLTVAAGIDRLITWDPHCTPIHGFYGQVPINNLEPLPLFLSAYRRFQNQLEVICIAPDGGRFQISHLPGPIIDLNCAIASKDRPNSEEAVISEVIGDFSGKQTAIVVDGMISSGGTIYELVKKLVNEKGITEVLIGVSHNLCMEVARQRLIDLSEHYGLKQLVVTDSIPQTKLFRELPFISIASLADIFARVINRIHFNRSITLAINGGIENV